MALRNGTLRTASTDFEELVNNHKVLKKLLRKIYCQLLSVNYQSGLNFKLLGKILDRNMAKFDGRKIFTKVSATSFCTNKKESCYEIFYRWSLASHKLKKINTQLQILEFL